MKIKANIPYEIKYYLDAGRDKKIHQKSEEEILQIILQNAQIKRIEYDDLEMRNKIKIESVDGASISLDEYVNNQLYSYYNDLEQMEKELNESFVITFVVPKNDYDTEDDFFLSDDEKIEKIRNNEKFRGFVEITEKTDDEKFFIGRKIDDETQRQQVYYVKLIHAFDKEICLIDMNKEEMDNIILRDSIPFTTSIIMDPNLSEEEFGIIAKQLDEMSYNYPVMTVWQYESLKAQQDALITVDEDNNIKVNSDAFGIIQNPQFKDMDQLDEVEYMKVDGKWINVGKIKKNVLVNEDEVVKFDESFDPKSVEEDLFKKAMEWEKDEMHP